MLSRLSTLVLPIAACALMACGGGEAPNSASSSDIKSAAADMPKLKVPSAAEIQSMSPKALIKMGSETTEDLATVLAKVNDEATARAAVARIQDVAPAVNAVQARLENMDAEGMEMSLGLIQAMGKFGSAQMKLFTEAKRINDDHPELRPILEEAWSELDLE